MQLLNVQAFLQFPSRIVVSEAVAKEIDVASVKLRIAPRKLLLGIIGGYIEETVPGHIQTADHDGVEGGVMVTDYANLSILDIFIPPDPRKVFLLTRAECQQAAGDIEDFLNHSVDIIKFTEWWGSGS